MDKKAIKKFAVWARTELITRVTQRAYLYGIDGESELDAEQKEVNGRLLSPVELKQRRTLVKRVKEKGFKAVMDEAAYTWFNRFAALRYMEVNGVLPTKVRVFTSREGTFHPQILDDCMTMDNLEGLNKEIVFELKEKDATDELYKYLLITQCNALGSILPAMFEQIEDYTELLLPDNLLREGSVIEQMTTTIPEEDWLDAVQIIGWLYEAYNIEIKKETSRKKSINKNDIPYVTQLFTPDWIVRYLVENSLGYLWQKNKKESNNNITLNWEYYSTDCKQSEKVAHVLKEKYNNNILNPEEIKIIDPCMGSGHILVYCFDVLMEIYEEVGYKKNQIPELIIRNNLYGIDIDERAYQLACFAVLMKARKYDRRILSKKLNLNLCVICDSNDLDKWSEINFENGNSQLELDYNIKEIVDYLIDTFKDANEYGSIIHVKEYNYDKILDYVKFIDDNGNLDLSFSMWIDKVKKKLPNLIKQASILSKKYDICVTNPPYLGTMTPKLSIYAKNNYNKYRYDLYAIFIKRLLMLKKSKGIASLVTGDSWLTLSSFVEMRKELLSQYSIRSLIGLGSNAFEAGFGIVAFTLIDKIDGFKGIYIDDRKNGDQEYLKYINDYKYEHDCNVFLDLKDSRIIYNSTDYDIDILKKNKDLSQKLIPKAGIVAGKNDLYLRLWHEVDFNKVTLSAMPGDDYFKYIWVPLHKGGGFRKWYGLDEYVIKLAQMVKDRKIYKSIRIGDEKFYFKEGLTWSTLSDKFAVRLGTNGFVFNTKGSMCFSKNSSDLIKIISLLNSKVSRYFINIISPNLDYNSGTVVQLPYFNLNDERIYELANKCIDISKKDWDSNETSWNFSNHPLIVYRKKTNLIKEAIEKYRKECNSCFYNIKKYEEELNELFINMYGLKNELSCEVNNKDITISYMEDLNDNIGQDSDKTLLITVNDCIKSLLSYAVGCMFGRYSLDVPGLAYAGGEFDWSKYTSFRPDEDDIIPICDDGECIINCVSELTAV